MDTNRDFDSEPFTEDGADFLKKIDFRPILLFLRLRWFWFGAVFLVVLVLGWGGVKFASRNSMSNWETTARMFHQTRSDKVPSFYRQLDSKTIVGMIATSNTMRRAGNILTLPESDIPRLLGLINVSVDKNKPNIINIVAHYKQPEFAAQLANAVAEAAIVEYVEFQNSTLKKMLEERNKRRDSLNGELRSLEAKQGNYISQESSFSPDAELARLQLLISSNMQQINDLKIKEGDLAVRIEQFQTNLSQVDKEVSYISKVHNGSSSEVEAMKKQLASLQERYTEKNPRISFLRNEIALREELVAKMPETPNEIIYSANQIYLDLQQKLLNAQIEQQLTAHLLDSYESQLDGYRKRALELQETLANYNQLGRNIESVKVTLRQLETSINELNFLLNSTIPDLSILENASKPRFSQKNSATLWAMIIAIFVTGGLAGCVVLYELVMGKILSVKEMTLILDCDSLGEIPDAQSENISEAAVQSSMVASFNALRNALGDSKRLFVGRLVDGDPSDDTLNCWTEHFGVNGYRIFRLKCLSLEYREQERNAQKQDEHAGAQNKKYVRNEVDDKLVYVEKFGNRGIFTHTDKSFLTPAECDILREDLAALTRHYDLILLERPESLKDCGQFFAQMADLVDYSVLFGQFGSSGKVELRELNAEIKRYRSDLKMGSVLTKVKPPFWKD